MKKLIATVFFCLLLGSSFSQTQRKISAYFLTQYNRTVRDYTIGNNPWGIGFGLQAFFNNKTRIKPTAELTADAYLMDDKVLRLNPDGSSPENYEDVRGMVNLFLGASYHPTNTVYLSLVAGPSVVGGQTLAGIKPSVGFYFSKEQKWTGKLSYINIFNRTVVAKEDFESISLILGLRLL